MPRFYGRHFFLGFTPSSEIDVDLTNAKNNGRDHLQITFTGVRQGLGFGTRRVVDVEVSTMKVILSKNTFDFLDNTSPSILPLSTNRAREECGSEGSGSWGLQSCRRLPRVFFYFLLTGEFFILLF